MKEKLKTKKELRQDKEMEADKNKQAAPYPSDDQLRTETEAEAPQVFLTIFDDSNTPAEALPTA